MTYNIYLCANYIVFVHLQPVVAPIILPILDKINLSVITFYDKIIVARIKQLRLK